MSQRKFLGRESILRHRRKVLMVEPTGLDGPIYVGSLSAGEGAHYIRLVSESGMQQDAIAGDEPRAMEAIAKVQVEILALVLCDENGERLFNADDPEELRLLGASFPATAVLETLMAFSALAQNLQENVRKNSKASTPKPIVSATA
jgi:hypothetical protein